ncbi:RNA polymerase sigma factor [Ureibacillus aquaedulcis]|uniref:Sigma-70 family RNA polymerase sigma factor n=1 Tax=Ureibacillus aquaedulcis TaxID=3058421 RepID=A0ABT8GPE6_9BACL|nr:sigma-70 family RNA polymerase sigma factor [Ureibacillus sp. BA0131]MDN4493297.1 sigma-70 family RNA polymerase sigma factor [Ureibacillus sp. BA0131]
MQKHLEEVLELYGDYLLRIAYTYVKDKRIAEEILQDVIFAYYRKHGQYRGEATLKTYLTRMTINRSYDHLRSWKNKKELLMKKIFDKDKSKSVEMCYIENEEKLEITRIVFTLKVKQREIILLYYYADHTTKEIAEILNKPESTIKSRLQKARAELRGKLQDTDWEVLVDENRKTF